MPSSRTSGHVGMRRGFAATALMALLFGAAGTAAAGEAAGASPIKGTIRHAFYIADGGRGMVLRFSPEGKLLWEFRAPNCFDLCVLPNGNVVFACRMKGRDYGVREVTPDKKVVWEYKAKGEVFSCQRLPDGNTLVGECTNARLVEVNQQGKVVKEIKVKVRRGGHATMRMARKTKDGTYLVGHPGDRAVREYSATGEVVREFKTPGPAYGALRLDNGNTLYSCQHSVIEVDGDGKVVWKVTAKEIPEVGPKWLASISRLPNGNTVIGNWLGHHQEGKGVPLFEVTPDKKVVWQFTDTVTTRHVTNFVIVDEK